MHETGRSVQIPRELFMALCRWHLGGIQDPEAEEAIRAGLQRKLDAAAARENFKKRLTTP